MVQRSIPEELVTEVLAAPDLSYADGEEFVAEKMGPENKPFRVVYTVQGDRSVDVVIQVISVYRIRKLKTS